MSKSGTESSSGMVCLQDSTCESLMQGETASFCSLLTKTPRRLLRGVGRIRSALLSSPAPLLLSMEFGLIGVF